MSFLRVFFGCSAALVACAGPIEEGPLGVELEWGLSEPSALPSEVETIRVFTCTTDDAGARSCGLPVNCSPNGLRGETPSEPCRPAEGSEDIGMEPVFVSRDLPTGTSVSFLIEGLDEAGLVTHTGQAGPLLLSEGERRQVRVQMWQVGASTVLQDEVLPRFLHTTSLLPDGRVLVAGGFGPLRAADCPSEPGLADGSRCFRASAIGEALAFEFGSGRVETIRSGMLAARGGHTATTLPDGRVLLVGGASEAVVAVVPIGGPRSGRVAIMVLPVDDSGDSTALASFELFDAFLGNASSDPERDGDPARGGFLGAGGAGVLGATNEARFLHAAAAVGDRVVIAGGLGGAESSETYEVFDSDKAGGYGFYRAGASNRLGTARAMPSAVGLGEQVWIFGGALATENAELAEIWKAGEDPNGTVRDATEDSEFPSSMEGASEDRPEYSLIRPAVAAVDGGRRALVVGWYGARCEPMNETPVFAGRGRTELCNSPPPPATRSFTVHAETGVATPTESRPQAFAEVALTQDFDTTAQDARSRIVVIGGVANTTWSAQRRAEVYTSGVEASGEASKQTAGRVSLEMGRFFHTSTGVPGLGVVSVGGLELTSADPRLVEEVEIVWLAE